ncbi:hypothetical protein PIB30_055156 [Stylosanthes scabra]|uniref:Ubiquitin-like protease family profile domain-containing protein n=1 Tax=Stylosanthes scabra TaxID=79078 RepID=A0ABU6SJS6_9FABA|nr:hypothetical protein [Stylosanthes scabra]
MLYKIRVLELLSLSVLLVIVLYDDRGEDDHHKDVFLEMFEAHGEQLQIVTELVRHQAKVIESYGRGRAISGKPPQLPPMGIQDMFPVSSHVMDDADNANPETPLKRRLEFDEGASLEPPLFPMEIHSSGLGTPFGYCNAADELYAQDMPKCLNLRFWPPAGMVFWASDIFYAAYIFKADGLVGEKLVQDEHCDGSKGTLWSFCPREEVFGDVITLVAGLMTFKKRGECGVWWLPTTFASQELEVSNGRVGQIRVSPFRATSQNLKNEMARILNEPRKYQPNSTRPMARLAHIYERSESTRESRLVLTALPGTPSETMMGYIQRRYMGLLADVQKIYVPIYAGRHWFLMIVNVMDETLIYLDSLKHKDFCDVRVKLMFDVGDYIESMLRSDTHGAFKSKGHMIPEISTYGVHEPRISQQDSRSNDCGVWVCEWMRTFQTWRDYDVQGICDVTRMTLAVDLVYGDHNPLQGEILNRAIKSWDKQMVAAASSRRSRTVSRATSTII